MLSGTPMRSTRLFLAALSAFVVALWLPARAADPAPPAELVDLSEVAPHVRIDMRYATPDNFLHAAVYPCTRCLLRRPVAEALARAQKSLEAQGLGLRVWDCYRPPEVQQQMWKLVPDSRYVANPKTGSVHNRGGAVDITLVDSAGKALAMPTPFDDFTPAAAAEAPASPEASKNRATLRNALQAEGLVGIKTEWWHFDGKGSRSWPILDAPLCKADARPDAGSTSR